MSSSYISAAELEQRKKAEQERERQEQLRKIKEATDEFIQRKAALEEFQICVSLNVQWKLQSFHTIDELHFACEMLQSVESSIDVSINTLLAPSIPLTLEEIKEFNREMDSGLENIGQVYAEGLSAFSQRISVYEEGQSDLKHSNEFSDALSKIENEKQHKSLRLFTLISKMAYEDAHFRHFSGWGYQSRTCKFVHALCL